MMPGLARRLRSEGRTFAIFAAASALLALNISRYYPFIADDSLISLRYSARLLAGHGLTWTAGEAVEGYSNLLWVLVCAALGGLGLDLIDAARVAGIGSILVCLVALAVTFPARGRAMTLALALGMGALVTAHSIAIWSIGGLEQALLAGLLAVALAGLTRAFRNERVEPRDLRLASFAFAGICLTRPDGPLFVVAAAAAVLIIARRDERPLRLVVSLGWMPVLAVVAQLCFRLLYYRDYVPNTAHIKVAWTSQRLVMGWDYLRAGLGTMWPLVTVFVLACIVAAVWSRHRRLLAAPLAIGLVWSAYVVAIGGDIFPGRRHLVPLVVCMSWAATTLLAQLPLRRTAYAVVTAIAVVALTVGLQELQSDDREMRRAINERWEWAGEAVSRMLVAAMGKADPLLAVDPAGCLPYFTGFRSIDMLGLNDRTIARTKPPALGSGVIGHEHGNGAYVYSRAPDLVLFCSPQGDLKPCYTSGRELMAMPEFQRDYRPATLRSLVSKDETRIYLRVPSERIGAAPNAGRIFVPPWLLGDGARLPVEVERDGSAHVRTTTEAPARLAGLELPPGNWRAEARAHGGDVKVLAWSPNEQRALDASSELRGIVDLSVVPMGTSATVTGIELSRVSPAD